MNNLNLNSSINKGRNPSFQGIELSGKQRAFKTGVREFVKIVPASFIGYTMGGAQEAISAGFASKILLDIIGAFRSDAGTKRYVSELNLSKICGETIPNMLKQTGKGLKTISDKISTIF